MHVLSTRRLLEDLARGRVSQRDKAYYLLVGWLLYVVIGYSTLVFANQGRTWLGLLEAFMIVVIAVLGIQSCYEASGGDNNKHFVVDFTCLLVPLTIKVYVAVWGTYWLFAWGYHAMHGATFESERSAYMVAFLSRHAGWFMTLIAVLVTQAALFLRMRVHMAALADLRETSNPLMQPTGQERPAAD
jgi:hypothetical protein